MMYFGIKVRLSDVWPYQQNILVYALMKQISGSHQMGILGLRHKLFNKIWKGQLLPH